jgi:ABC-type dipeptide/oligopeptide/nickel transport system ATPase component
VSLIPQGAMNSLNPVMRVGAQVAEVLVTHERMPRRAVKARVDELFGLVGLPQRAVSVYPHELSGGMKQRASIAMAVALNPDLIVADEPTSALDVVTQRLVVQTLIDVKERFGSSLLMAGHDIALLAQVADRLAVMRDGVVVEMGETGELLENPLHPYTQLLITSVPVLHAEPAGPASATEAAPDVADAAILSAAEDELAMAEPDVVEHPLREVTPGHFAALPDSDV